MLLVTYRTPEGIRAGYLTLSELQQADVIAIGDRARAASFARDFKENHPNMMEKLS